MTTTQDDSGHDPQTKSPKTKAQNHITLIKAPLMKNITAATISFISASLVFISYYKWSTQPEFSHDPVQYMTQLISDPYPTNMSHIAFGIGGSAKTWSHRSKYSDLWWVPGSTRGFAFLDNKPDRGTSSKIPVRVSSRGWTRFGSSQAVRVARVVTDLYRVGLPNVRWFVMGDDDTVFFPDNLLTVLSGYDHREMVYVGGNSESVEQNVMHAYDMAFGGGGFAISYPLAVELGRSMDGCLERYGYFYGSDQRVWACVGEIGVELSREMGFHQLDIRGDAFGLLAAHPLAPLVSLHHLDDIKPIFPNQTQIDSLQTLIKPYVLDPSRTLQQCYCYHHKYKWSISISWGYVVQIYPSLVTAKELEMPLQTFQTWRSWADGPFTFNTRPLGNDQACMKPIVFYFDSGADADGDGVGTLTSYRKLDHTAENNCDRNYDRAVGIDSIVVYAPKMDPREWKQGRRRYCCEINGSLKSGRMSIGIRKCKKSETFTI